MYFNCKLFLEICYDNFCSANLYLAILLKKGKYYQFVNTRIYHTYSFIVLIIIIFKYESYSYKLLIYNKLAGRALCHFLIWTI